MFRRHHDAIVNAANTSLLGGRGVDGAIHRAAGPRLLAECRNIRGCPAGEARLAGGYRLPASPVIHTGGPIWQGAAAGERESLTSYYRSSLALAARLKFYRIAFPAILTGIYGFPRREAAQIAMAAVGAHLTEHEFPHAVIFDVATFDAHRKAMGQSA